MESPHPPMLQKSLQDILVLSLNSSSLGGMQAMVANQPEFVDENCWFPDSGAANHLTNDLANLAISSEYTGSGKIYMGNEHTSLNSNSHILHLKNLLHVPLITKDLL